VKSHLEQVQEAEHCAAGDLSCFVAGSVAFADGMFGSCPRAGVVHQQEAGERDLALYPGSEGRIVSQRSTTFHFCRRDIGPSLHERGEGELPAEARLRVRRKGVSQQRTAQLISLGGLPGSSQCPNLG
jgi:hypothetical protein